MKDIKDNVVIQIEVTNACHLSCANCSRLVGHHYSPFYMTVAQVRQALESLEEFPGRVGLMGGEPALHPNFEEICKLFIHHIPDRRRREFWTSGYKWEEFRAIREETFDSDLVHYNDHSKPDEGWHQPLLISIDEVLEDKETMWRLIDNCWVQRRWSASITPKGAFFCEVAAALHHAMDGPQGWKVEPGWWKREVSDYHDQKTFACLKCSAALPMAEIPNNHIPDDQISAGNLELLKGMKSPKVKAQRVLLIKKKDATSYLNSNPNLQEGERGYWRSHPDWRPSEFRTQIFHEPGEGTLGAKAVRDVQRGKDKSLAEVIANAKGVNQQVIARHRRGKLKLAPETITSLRQELSERAELLQPLVGMEFEDGEQFMRSLDDWSGYSLTVREKDVILKHIYDPI